MICLLCSSCNGILDNIYNDQTADQETDFGFKNRDEKNKSGIIYIDASSYTQWVYIDFQNLLTSTLDVNDNEPDQWDFAIHRYDTKTNGGKAIETQFSEFSAIDQLPTNFVADVWTEEQIIIDMSEMMEGKIKYIASYYNVELSKWLNVDKSTMPPIYTMPNKVYFLKLKDNSLATMKLKSYMNQSGTKGYMTIEYIYPYQL